MEYFTPYKLVGYVVRYICEINQLRSRSLIDHEPSRAAWYQDKFGVLKWNPSYQEVATQALERRLENIGNQKIEYINDSKGDGVSFWNFLFTPKNIRKINMLNPKMIWWMVQMIFPFQFRVIFRFELLYEKTLCWKKTCPSVHIIHILKKCGGLKIWLWIKIIGHQMFSVVSGIFLWQNWWQTSA